jgi:hypothetical protein
VASDNSKSTLTQRVFPIGTKWAIVNSDFNINPVNPSYKSGYVGGSTYPDGYGYAIYSNAEESRAIEKRLRVIS